MRVKIHGNRQKTKTEFQTGDNISSGLTPHLRRNLSSSRHRLSAGVLSRPSKRRNRPTQRAVGRLEPNCPKLHPAPVLPHEKRLRFRSRSRHNPSRRLFTNPPNTKRHRHSHRCAHPNSKPKHRRHLLDNWQPLRKRPAHQSRAYKSISFNLQRISVRSTWVRSVSKQNPVFEAMSCL
jgi:hypothetical protein